MIIFFIIILVALLLFWVMCNVILYFEHVKKDGWKKVIEESRYSSLGKLIMTIFYFPCVILGK